MSKKKVSGWKKLFSVGQPSISRCVTISLLVIVAAVQCVLVAVLYYREAAVLRDEIERKADDYTARIGELLSVPMWDFDQEQIAKIGENFAHGDIVDEIHILDDHGKELYTSKRRSGLHKSVWKSVNITYGGQNIGRVDLAFSLDAYQENLNQLRNIMLLLLLGTLALITFTTGLFVRIFMRKPLTVLQEGIGRVKRGEFDFPFEQVRFRELTEIARDFSKMAVEVRSREATLSSLNEQMQREISERQRAESKMRALMDAMPDVVFLISRRGVFMDCMGSRNDPHLKVRGFIGKTIEDVFPANVAGLWRLKLNQVLTETEGQYYEFTVPVGNESTFFECHMVAVDGEVALAIVRNITERKTIEADRQRLEAQLMQSQKLEAIGTLAGGIAHDFNNILAAIMGYVEIAQVRIKEPDTVRKDLDQALKASRRARDLIRQILAFSERRPEDRKPIDAASQVRETTRLLQSTLPATVQIQLHLRAKETTVFCEPTAIQQILMNLGTNAYHAMQSNGGILNVELENIHIKPNSTLADFLKLNPGHYLKLIVKDTGCGIPPAILDRVFEPYFTTKDKGQGTGLGLAVVRNVVRRMGGAIRVSSNEGHGTCFEVLLPVVDQCREQTVPRATPVPGGGERILFVDDELVLVRLCQEMLEHFGYRITAVTSGTEARDIFMAQPDLFDLVIADLVMPGMTGDMLAKELLRIRPDIPILLCSGYGGQINREKLLEIGIRDVLSKPLGMDELALRIRTILDEVK